jgi:hypothetical protein
MEENSVCAGQPYAKFIKFQLCDCRSENKFAWRVIRYGTYTDRDHIRGIYRRAIIMLAVLIQNHGDRQVKDDRKVKQQVCHDGWLNTNKMVP